MRYNALLFALAPSKCQDRIFDELNTLSVVYRAPAATFIDAGEAAGARSWGRRGLGRRLLPGGQLCVPQRTCLHRPR